MPMANNAFPTAGRFRYVASDRTDRPWITLRANRGVRSLGTSSPVIDPQQRCVPVEIAGETKGYAVFVEVKLVLVGVKLESHGLV